MNRLASSFIIIAVLSLWSSCIVYNKNSSSSAVSANNARPKLIIGITVDQMRADYIDKYWNDFSEGGFKRLVNHGFFARNTMYNFMPTFTGPGHAAIFTGTTPALNGIIANDWFVRSLNKMTYCAADSTVVGVGTASASGKMSPHYLQSTTLGDEMKMFTNNGSKVVGIALKDRGAILPAGRTADAAYWFVGGTEGVWASSSWYMNELPQWVQQFNGSKRADYYMDQTWNLLLNEANYSESLEDNNPYEAPFKGTIRPTFPYVLRDLAAQNGNYELLKAVPMGNELTIDFAKAAIEGEKLGADAITDMLCLSFSATDYVGHQFGIHSRELQDCYLRLDRALEAFLNYLDQQIGKDQYLLFMSADHAGAPTPSYVMSQQGSAGYWKSDGVEEAVNRALSAKYGEGTWVLNETNQNVFLNRALLTSKNISLEEAQRIAVAAVLELENVERAYRAADLAKGTWLDPIGQRVQLGFSQKESGDIIYIIRPGYMEYGMQGTTHGSPYVYDSHVPAIFYGWRVKPGESYAPHTICDIAPTISSLCRFPFPNANIGNPISIPTK